MYEVGSGGGAQAPKAIPRRAAARKASRLAAEQLESSPIPDSDAEDSKEVRFGEPSTPKSTVKVTYGGKRKQKQSPPKLRVETGVGTSQSRRRALSLVDAFPNKPISAAGRGLGVGREPGRSGRIQGRPRDSSIENDAIVPSESEVIIVEDDLKPAKLSRRNTIIGSENGLSDANGIKGHGLASKGSRKRPFSTSSVGTSDGAASSSLTSLSSPEEVKTTSPFPPSNIAPRLARQFWRTQSHAVPRVVSDHRRQPFMQSKSLDSLFAPLDSSDDESCDEAGTDYLVWVCINTEGGLADSHVNTDDDTLWWPAKVESPKPLLRVALFGRPPGFTGKAGERRLDIRNPRPANIRSRMLDDHARFNEGTYRSSRSDSLHSSPRKKRRLDLDTAWKEARDLMMKADEDGSDVLGSYSGRYAAASSSRQNGSDGTGKGEKKSMNGKAKAEDSDVDDDDFSLEPSTKPEQRWRAPSADLLLELPGELVVAREARNRSQYWPAKLLQYIKPQKRTQRPKYKVVFFDGIIKYIERDWFWTTTDEEFATCRLGESTDNYGLDDDNDALDDLDGAEDFNRPFASEDEAILRAFSPLPGLPAPDAEIFQYELSIAEQFEYIKPILAAILEYGYEPATLRTEEFMRGGGARRKVLESIPPRGSLSSRDKEEVAFLVRSWARRRERRKEMGMGVEYPHDKLYPVEYVSAGTTSVSQHDDADSVLTPTSDLSIGDTELLAPSEADAPPSSFVPTEAETDDEKEAYVRQEFMGHETAVPEDAINVITAAEVSSASEDVRDGNAEAIIMGDDKPSTTAERVAVPPNTTLPSPPPRMSFHDLDAVEKITYCNNVLLQEAILQLLLWRTGQRRSLGLLSPEEEQRLHGIALKEGEKTDWVHDIIRLRQASEKKMLPSAKLRGKMSESAPVLGTRRTRRGA